jgi:hypothetical protein
MGVIGYEDLIRHVGHKIYCRRYTKTDPVEATIECETCQEILYSEFKTCPECGKEMTEYGRCPDKCQE